MIMLLVMPGVILAQTSTTNNTNTANTAAKKGGKGLQDARAGLNVTAGAAFGSVPTNKKTVYDLISQGIQIVLGFVGIIFMILIIIGGLQWMTSSGDQTKVEKAKKTITSATIGLVLILAAYALTVFVVETIIGVVSG